MSQEFTFSDPGEGLQEAEVLEIFVEEGGRVKDGDTLLSVETDKAATDVPAPFSGTIEKIHVNVGDTVRVDDLLMTYTPEGEEGDTKPSSDEEKRKGKDKDAGEKPAQEESEEGAGDAKDKEEQTADESQTQVKKEEGKEKEEKEKEKEKEEQEQEPASRPQPDEDAKSKQRSRNMPVPAAPSTRRIAYERGVDLHDVEPSGPHGRVTTEDVEAYASGKGARMPEQKEEREEEATAGPATTKSKLPDFSRWGETERQPMRSIRRITAERMAQSWREIPHVFHQDVADVTELERFRREYAESAQAEGGKFTMTILVMKAMVYAMKRFPRFNASLDSANQEIVLKRYYNVGMAVASDRGLLVPVIRDVDRKDLIELTREVSETVGKAREGELGREDMEGGSMTLTNPGSLGGTSLSPIINQPEVAILGLGQARLEPVVFGSLDSYEIKPRLMLPLSLGFDHRVNDGADAAQFVTTLIEALQDPRSLMLRL